MLPMHPIIMVAMALIFRFPGHSPPSRVKPDGRRVFRAAQSCDEL
jgi:hypothetical protein